MNLVLNNENYRQSPYVYPRGIFGLMLLKLRANCFPLSIAYFLEGIDAVVGMGRMSRSDVVTLLYSKKIMRINLLKVTWYLFLLFLLVI